MMKKIIHLDQFSPKESDLDVKVKYTEVKQSEKVYTDYIMCTFTIDPKSIVKGLDSYNKLIPEHQQQLMLIYIQSFINRLYYDKYIKEQQVELHFEFTKKGDIHTHTLMQIDSKWVPYPYFQNTLKKIWKQQTNSIMDIQYVFDLPGIQKYITKDKDTMPQQTITITQKDILSFFN